MILMRTAIQWGVQWYSLHESIALLEKYGFNRIATPPRGCSDYFHFVQPDLFTNPQVLLYNLYMYAEFPIATLVSCRNTRSMGPLLSRCRKWLNQSAQRSGCLENPATFCEWRQMLFTRLPQVLQKEATASPEADSGRDIPSTSRGTLSTEGPAIGYRGIKVFLRLPIGRFAEHAKDCHTHFFGDVV